MNGPDHDHAAEGLLQSRIGPDAALGRLASRPSPPSSAINVSLYTRGRGDATNKGLLVPGRAGESEEGFLAPAGLPQPRPPWTCSVSLPCGSLADGLDLRVFMQILLVESVPRGSTVALSLGHGMHGQG